MSATTETAEAPEAAVRVVRPRRSRGAGLGLLAWLAGILFFLPIAWMALTSFHSEEDAATNPRPSAPR